MIRLLSSLLNTVVLLNNKVRADQAFDEGLAYYDKKQYAEAFPLIKESAEEGSSARAMSLLGSMYVLGYGIKEDGNEAIKWLVKAMENGDAVAVGILGMVYVTGKAGAPRKMKEGIALLEKAVENGDEKSAKMLTAIRNGEGMFRKLR